MLRLDKSRIVFPLIVQFPALVIYIPIKLEPASVADAELLYIFAIVFAVIIKEPAEVNPYDIIPITDWLPDEAPVFILILLVVVRLPIKLLLIVVVPAELDGVTFIPVNPLEYDELEKVKEPIVLL